MLGSLGSLALLATSAGGALRGYVAGGGFLAATLGYVLVQVDRQRRQRRRALDRLRHDHSRALAVVRRGLATPAGDPEAGLPHGRGPGPAPQIEVPTPDPDADPACVLANARFAAVHGRPMEGELVLPWGGHLTVRSRDEARALALEVPPGAAVAVHTRDPAAWEWLAWLPQAWSLQESDGLGPARLVGSDAISLARSAPSGDRLLWISDHDTEPAPPEHATHVRVDRSAPALTGAPRVSRVEAAARARRRDRSTARASAADLDTLLASPRPPLTVPIGLDEARRPVLLDLRETAQGGVGPHGLLVGATGSGKSELLRTLVVGLTLTHPSTELNLVLVDFKGGATFAPFADLPHTAALITNLADDESLLDRTHDALTGELVRRQEVLRAAGVASVSEGGHGLPTLVIVVDEFSELLAGRPDLTDLFVQIGRLGRSLGLHLLLATQRLEEGRLRGLESHLSYRVALRTFSESESRAVLGVPDAHHLLATPGAGLLRTGPDDLRGFRALRATDSARTPGDVVRRITVRPVASTEASGDSPLAAATRLTGPSAHQVWCPPLDEAPEQATLPPGGIGLVDRPREQRHDPLVVDLSGAGGHVAVVGGPRSGKSTLATAVVCAEAIRCGPDDLAVRVLDPAGDLASLDVLPHLVGRATRAEPDLARRLVQDALATPGRSLLVVDGWATCRDWVPGLEEAVLELASSGLAAGRHLLLTSGRWADLRPALRDQLGTRLELRLGDPLDSEVDRRRAAAVPPRPGRGLTPDGHHFLGAIPAPDQVARAWPPRTAPRTRALPDAVALDSLTGWALADDGTEVAPVPHLLVVGDPGAGRTTTLRALLARSEDQVLVVDPRGSLAGAVADERLLDHLSGDTAAGGVADLAAVLGRRLSGERGTTPVTVVVDDHDLLGLSGAGDPLDPLVRLLPRAADVGLRLVVARRAGGLARSQHLAVLQTWRDVAAPTLVLSCATAELPVAGVRPRPERPGRGHLVLTTGTRLVQVGC